MDGGALSEALTQGGFQVGWPVVLAQKVAEGFLGQLKGHPAVAGKQIGGLPRFIVGVDPLSGHPARHPSILKKFIPSRFDLVAQHDCVENNSC